MDTERLFTKLASIHPLSNELKNTISEHVVSLSFPKDYLLLEAPKMAEHAYFLLEGFAMTYSYVRGRRFVEAFWEADQLIVSARSFFEQKPSREFIRLVQPSHVLCISYQSVQEIFSQFPETQAIYRGIIHEYFEEARTRVRSMAYQSTWERYKGLKAVHPQIEQLVTQENIAAYLGITPQSFSRMKKEKSLN